MRKAPTQWVHHDPSHKVSISPLQTSTSRSGRISEIRFLFRCLGTIVLCLLRDLLLNILPWSGLFWVLLRVLLRNTLWWCLLWYWLVLLPIRRYGSVPRVSPLGWVVPSLGRCCSGWVGLALRRHASLLCADILVDILRGRSSHCVWDAVSSSLTMVVERDAE